MGLIDFILNLAGLLLWLNWRSVRFDPLGKRTPATLIGTLRRAEPRRLRRWHLLAALGGLLLLSLLAGPEPLPFHRLVRMPLGGIDRWARGVKFLLPLIVTATFWWLASWLLAELQIIPKPVSTAQRFEESLVIGLSSYLTWKYLAGALLVLHLLNSYIYFGKHPFWGYVNAGAQTLLSPLRALPLRVGKADFAPVVGIVLVFLAAELAGRGLVFLYERLPL